MNQYSKKFRGYNKALGWIYGFGLIPVFDFNNKLTHFKLFTEDHGAVGVELGSQGEYSGVSYYDKMFYENDIVLRIAPIPVGIDNEKYIGIVKFYEGKWVLDNGTSSEDLWSEWHEYELLGNEFSDRQIAQAVLNQ